MEPLSTQTEDRASVGDPCSSQAPTNGLAPEASGEASKTRNGDASPQSTPPAPSSYSELEKLSEAELKAAIKSAWKKHEPRLKKDMAPLLYFLRLRLGAQGARNDIHDQGRGFGAWVEKNAGISRATADRWAREYGLANGLITAQATSNQVSESKDDAFYKQELDKHPEPIRITCPVSQTEREQYEQDLKFLKDHYKTTHDGEAILKGLSYAAKTLAKKRGADRNVHATATGGASVGDVSNPNGNERHRGKKRPRTKGAVAG